MNRHITGMFRAVKLFCGIPQWWTHVIKHLFNPWKIQAKNEARVHGGLWVVMTCQRRFMSCNKRIIW